MQKTDLELIDVMADFLYGYDPQALDTYEDDAKLFIEELSDYGYSIVKDSEL